jgi:hypothetical protein
MLNGFGQLQMEETYLLFSDELDNGHYNALFSLEEKRTGISDEVFYMQPSPKTFQ